MNPKKKKKRENINVYFITLQTISHDHIWPRPRTEKKKKNLAHTRKYPMYESSCGKKAKDSKRNNNSGLSIQLILSGRYLDFRCDRSIPEPGVGHCRGPQPLLCHVPTSPGCWRPRRGSCRRAGTRRSLSSSNLPRARSIPSTSCVHAPLSLSLSHVYTRTRTRAHVRARDQARGFRFVQRANKNKRRLANWIYRGGARSAPGLRLLNAVLSTSKRTKPRFPSPHTVSAFAIAWNSRPWRAPRRSILSTRRAVRWIPF